jgi:pyruvate/2-oxoglutarate dehydrogenase complex dihydrolipoamide acyltransferase (E2) component
MRESARARQRARQRFAVWRPWDASAGAEATVVAQLCSTFAGVSPSLAREMVVGALLFVAGGGGAAQEQPTQEEEEENEEAEEEGAAAEVAYAQAVARASSLRLKDLDEGLWRALNAQWAFWVRAVSDDGSDGRACAASARMLLGPSGASRGYSVVAFAHYWRGNGSAWGPPPPLPADATPGGPCLPAASTPVLAALAHYYGAQQLGSEFTALRLRAVARAASVCRVLEKRCAVRPKNILSRSLIPSPT